MVAQGYGHPSQHASHNAAGILTELEAIKGPAMQGLMGSYIEQSKTLFEKMQEQMTEQAKALFPGMPGLPPNNR